MEILFVIYLLIPECGWFTPPRKPHTLKIRPSGLISWITFPVSQTYIINHLLFMHTVSITNLTEFQVSAFMYLKILMLLKAFQCLPFMLQFFCFWNFWGNFTCPCRWPVAIMNGLTNQLVSKNLKTLRKNSEKRGGGVESQLPYSFYKGVGTATGSIMWNGQWPTSSKGLQLAWIEPLHILVEKETLLYPLEWFLGNVEIWK